MEKYSLIEESKHHKFREGDIIRYEMPSFCSGEYLAKVFKDPDYGFYIDKEDDYFKGCRGWNVHNINDENCPEWLKKEYEGIV